MSSGDAWKEREKALEESFFFNKNRELLAEFKQSMETAERRKTLSSRTGIQDEEVLNHLIACEISDETLAAISLVPLIVVAWADGRIDEKERDAIITAIEDEGIEDGSVCHKLLERWFKEPPDSALIDAWKGYIGCIATKLNPDAQAALKAEILGRVKSVARAAGGILGLKSISSAEKAKLEELEQAFPA